MQLTLKDLHRLETAVHTAASQLADKARGQTALTLSAYDDSLAAKVEARQREVQDMLREALTLTALRYRIRDLIHGANESVRINNLLNQNARLQATIRILETVADPSASYPFQGREPYSNEMLARIEKKFSSVRENAGSAVALEGEVGLTTVFTKEVLDDFKRGLADTKRKLEKVKDQIGTLNMTTKCAIDLDEGLVALLKKHNVPYGAGD